MKTDNFLSQNVPNILIVDDILSNLKVLGDILRDEGYKVRPVLNGMMALQVAGKEKPDLIILDIMMPDMDGYEDCRQLKKIPNLSDIPIIFISALNDSDYIVKALKLGGVDYITKPFQAEEVKARVATHLKICLQNQELQRINAEKDKLLSIIAHDLRGPLGGFMTLTKMMEEDYQFLTPDKKRDISLNLGNSAQNIYNLLENLLEWAQMQRGQIAFKPQILNLKNIVNECMKTIIETARDKAIVVDVEIQNEMKIFADTNMLQTIIRNLSSNAIKFTPKRGKVSISAKCNENKIAVISVKDTGTGMDKEMLGNIFSISSKNRRPGTEGEPSTGLGLLLCKEFVEKNDGEIWAESEEGKGSVFYFTIPCSAEPITK
ncbi:MAG: hybrid sensor histidine kinase/response regulator [Bacteroidetes bacterium]|nr:hybrid sensor histidine kinase/response regulator [Bacteroidota bacterium]